jgi:hypothetical protein
MSLHEFLATIVGIIVLLILVYLVWEGSQYLS